MSILINNYPIFEDNQVLTSGQLNQLIQYLDQQNRLTRSCLIGMGIACGLTLELDVKNGTTLIIKEGLGISSEGFIIKLCPEAKACRTTQYRTYTLPEKAVYTPFQDDLFKQDVDLYELLTDEAKLEPEDKAKKLSVNFLKDKVVLLFLECLDKDLKSCLGKSCDELGIERIFTLRKLVISKEDLDKVNKRSNGGRQDDLFLQKFNLKDIRLPRVFFDKVHTLHYFPFSYKYIEAVNQVFEPLIKLLNESFDAYQPILEEIYGGNPFLNPIIEQAFKNIMEYLNGGNIQPSYWGVQYIYDFIKDLILAYHEFKDSAFDLMVQCCPDMTRFPRHLMLGAAIPKQQNKCELDVYRHSFTQPPIYNRQNYLLQQSISLHKRIVLMLEKFDFKRLDVDLTEKIMNKITPSCEKKSLLSARSIPYYYDSKSKSKFENLDTLELEWNFDHNHKQCQILEGKSDALNLSYDNNTMEKEPKTALTTPLHFDIDSLNFLRLEGLLGKDISESLAGLEQLKKTAHLDFDVKAIHFGDELPDKFRNKALECYFIDLQPQYEVWRGKLLYFLDVFARFTNVSSLLSARQLATKPTGLSTSMYTDYRQMKSMEARLSVNNWATTLEEVHYKSKAVNMYSAGLTAEMTTGFESATNDQPSISTLHNQMTDCISKIRQYTPEAFHRFNMDQWLTAFKCPLNTYVALVKLMANRIPIGTNTSAIHTYMSLYCALHETLRNLFVFPHIDIRILWNTLQNKINQQTKLNEFTYFVKTYSGLEHQAGLEQGQTFVLLYQGKYSEEYEKKMAEYLQAFSEKSGKLPFNEKDFPAFNKQFEGKVIADFTLPYKCCDPCSSIRFQTAQLDPIALPICETVPISELPVTESNDPNRFQYGRLKEKIFHSVYEPERYRAQLTSAPKLGTAELIIQPFAYDATRNTQIFTYDVDINKVMEAARSSDSAYLTDTLSYEIWNEEEHTKIDESTITILIPIIGSIAAKPTGIKGITYALNDNGARIPIPGTEVWVTVEDQIISAVTDKSGSYQLRDAKLVNGTYTVRAFATGYNSAIIRNVIIKNNITPLDIELKPQIQFDIKLKGIVDTLGLAENSSKSILITEEYLESNKMYEAILRESIAAEKENAASLKKVEETISRFTHDEKLTAKELNAEYTKNRDALLKEIEATVSPDSKKNKATALTVLTSSYMDRLITLEPKKLSAASTKTLKETTEVINKSEISMKADMEEWAKRKENVLGKNMMSKINTNFKLK